MMTENATFLSVCAGESQAGHPIGSALVFQISHHNLDVAQLHRGSVTPHKIRENGVVICLQGKGGNSWQPVMALHNFFQKKWKATSTISSSMIKAFQSYNPLKVILTVIVYNLR